MVLQNKMIKLTLIILLTCSTLLSGCIPGNYKRQKKDYCSDTEILTLLKNDNSTSEFVMDGDYYQLPCPLECFIQNDWRILGDQKIEDLRLPPQSWARITLDRFFHLVVVNYTTQSRNVADAMVVSITAWPRKELDPEYKDDYFVTKQGINAVSSYKTICGLCEGLDNFSHRYDHPWDELDPDCSFWAETTQSEIIRIIFKKEDYNCIIITADRETAKKSGINLYTSTLSLADKIDCLQMEKKECTEEIDLTQTDYECWNTDEMENDHERLDDQSIENLRSGILWDFGSGTGTDSERDTSQGF